MINLYISKLKYEIHIVNYSVEYYDQYEHKYQKITISIIIEIKYID